MKFLFDDGDQYVSGDGAIQSPGSDTVLKLKRRNTIFWWLHNRGNRGKQGNRLNRRLGPIHIANGYFASSSLRWASQTSGKSTKGFLGRVGAVMSSKSAASPGNIFANSY